MKETELQCATRYTARVSSCTRTYALPFSSSMILGLSNVSRGSIHDATRCTARRHQILLLLKEIQQITMLDKGECQFEMLTDRQSANGWAPLDTPPMQGPYVKSWF